MALPGSRSPAMDPTESHQKSDSPSSESSPGLHDSIQTSPAINPSSSPHTEKLPPGIALLIEREVEKRSQDLRRAGYLWKHKPLYQQVWSVLSNCILLATFATTIWVGISQRRADQASVAMAKSADEANALANQSLQIANQTEATAIEALSQSSANNNISATDNNNAASQELLTLEEYCDNNPSSNLVFVNATGSYNCSQILAIGIHLPTICVESADDTDSCGASSPHPISGAGLSTGASAGIAVGLSLPILALLLAFMYFYCLRPRKNKRASRRAGTPIREV